MADRNWISTVLICIAMLVCTTPVAHSQENALLVKLTDNIYARIVNPDGNAVGNSGFILLEHGVLVFDTHFTPEAGHQLLEDIRSITSKPIRYIVNSHYHPDHTHGNQAFPDAHVISNVGTRKDILQKDLPSLNRTMDVTASQLDRMNEIASKEEDPSRLERLQQQIRSQQDYLATLSQLKITAPFVILEDYMSIQDGLTEVRIQFLGPGHTDTDTILLLPEEKIVFCGDLFFKDAIPNIQDADILKWMDTLRRILELDADRFVPGHGIVGNRRDLERFLNYFEELRFLVEPYVLRGDSVERAIREIGVPEAYSRYRFINFFRANIQKMYAELKMLQFLSIPIEGPKLPAGR